MSNVKEYDVIWNAQSENSAQSMPCGGHDCGANIWVEKDCLFIYLDKSGSIDENGQLLKMGRLRFECNKPIFAKNFKQQLHLQEGYVTITGDNGFCTTVWFDVTKSVCHIDIVAEIDVEVKATYETWRTSEREIPQAERPACMSYMAYPHYVATYPDVVIASDHAIKFYHANRNDKLLFDFIVCQQNLSTVKDKLDNLQKNLIFGGKLYGNDLVYSGKTTGSYAGIDFDGYTVTSPPKREHHFKVVMHNSQCKNAEMWDNQLEGICKDVNNDLNSKQNALEWWNNFWERSYVKINSHLNENDEGYQISRNYTLFRYMLGCNAYGDYPTKFNGGLFTTDPYFTGAEQYKSQNPYFTHSEEHKGKTPDFRRWGGGVLTGQNQRLVYWPMLKSGDFDMMPSQFDFYVKALNNATVRTKEYWGHEGCSFTEQLENFGLPIAMLWGFDETEDKAHKRPKNYDPTEQVSPWTRYYYSTQLEFCFMILKYYKYTFKDISKYIPLIEKCVTFYFEHYKQMYLQSALREFSPEGKLKIFPSCALETYRDACNPTDCVAALYSVINELTQLDHYVDTKHYSELLKRVPDINYTTIRGKKVIAPAEFYREKVGDEFPELYPVFPYEFFNVGSEDKDVAIHTWDAREIGPYTYISWRQEPIFAARLGLVEPAKAYTVKKLKNGSFRFPAFWGPGHDWNPDHNWGGSGMIALQEMLLQQYGNKVYLLPAWPNEWDVEFKLHIEKQCTVTVSYISGKMSYSLSDPSQGFEVICCI